MPGYCSARARRSAKRWKSTVGTTVAASPHAAAGRSPSGRTWGTTKPQTPSVAACSAATSLSQPDRNASESNRVAAVGLKTWMSPVQPSRSSRWGQSVGIETKLPRMPHTTFSCSRFTRSSEHSNQPVRRMSLPTTTAVIAEGSRSPGQPVTSA
jgi:hypothetical protein